MFLLLFLGSFFGLKAEELQRVILAVCSREVSLSMLVPVTYKEMIHFSDLHGQACKGQNKAYNRTIIGGNIIMKYSWWEARFSDFSLIFATTQVVWDGVLNVSKQNLPAYNIHTSSMARKTLWFKREMKSKKQKKQKTKKAKHILFCLLKQQKFLFLNSGE